MTGSMYIAVFTDKYCSQNRRYGSPLQDHWEVFIEHRYKKIIKATFNKINKSTNDDFCSKVLSYNQITRTMGHTFNGTALKIASDFSKNYTIIKIALIATLSLLNSVALHYKISVKSSTAAVSLLVACCVRPKCIKNV